MSMLGEVVLSGGKVEVYEIGSDVSVIQKELND